MDLVAECYPDIDRPPMQAITIRARAEDDGRILCTLEALRYAQSWFHPSEMNEVVRAFDEHSAYAYGLAEEIALRRRVLADRYEEVDADGFIGITEIKTPLEERGKRLGVCLLEHLRRLHAGMTWFAALQAAPLELTPSTPAHRALRKRLVRYYGSVKELGFQEVSRASPGLMMALWEDTW